MSSSYLPLLATIPLLMVGITAILRFKVLDRLLLLAVPVLTMAGGLLLLERHRTDPVIAHHVGDFIGGIAIGFVSDALTAILLVITGLVTLFGSIYLLFYTLTPPPYRKSRYPKWPGAVLVTGGAVGEDVGSPAPAEHAVSPRSA